MPSVVLDHPLLVAWVRGAVAYAVNPCAGFALRFAAVTAASDPFGGAIGDGPRATEGEIDMATIANLTVKSDGSMDGTLATLNVTAPISIVPNVRKTKENEPDFRIISRKNGFELGAGWNRFSQNTGAEYVSVSLSAPEFGTIYGNVANAPGDDPSKKVIIWNPPA